MAEENTPPKGDGDTVNLNSDNWMEFVPEELREDPSITKFSDLGSMVKGYHNAVSMIGKDKIVMPETDEQFSEVYGRLGRPDEASGYELTAPEGVADDQKFDEEFDTSLKTAMHGLGLNGKQAQGMNEFLYGMMTTATGNNKAADEAAKAEALTELHSTYGADVDKHVEAGLRVVRELGGDEAGELIGKDDLLQNPVLVKIFSGIADKVLEAPNLPGDGGGTTIADIQSEIAEAMNHPGYTDGKHIEHKQIVQKVMGLRNKLHAAA